MGRRRGSTAFPVARIKKMMQSDEDVGKIATATPVLVAKALECMMEDVLRDAANVAIERRTKTVTPQHLKHSVTQNAQFDFLRTILASVPALDDPNAPPARRTKRYRNQVSPSAGPPSPPAASRPKRPRAPRSPAAPRVQPAARVSPKLEKSPAAVSSPPAPVTPVSAPPRPADDDDDYDEDEEMTPVSAKPEPAPAPSVASAPVSLPAAPQPVPALPVLSKPMPSQPEPAASLSSAPASSEGMPAQAIPAQSTQSQPTPSQSQPSQPTPAQAMPTQAMPTQTLQSSAPLQEHLPQSIEPIVPIAQHPAPMETEDPYTPHIPVGPLVLEEQPGLGRPRKPDTPVVIRDFGGEEDPDRPKVKAAERVSVQALLS